MINRIAIFSKPLSVSDLPCVEEVFRHLKRRLIKVVIHQDCYDHIGKKSSLIGQLDLEIIPSNKGVKNVDLVITLGGDGTFLNTLVHLEDKKIPIVGVNLGRLGFLNSVKKNEIGLLFEELEKNTFTIEKRQVLQLINCDEIPPYEAFALNDIAILKRDTSSMIEVKAYLQNHFLNSYWADGLIISTPTGSTGYSLSCGGPLLWPSANNFVLTPVSAHNMNVRPFVVPNNLSLNFEVNARTDHFLISLDTRSYDIPNHKSFEIRLADFDIHLIRTKDYDYINTLQKKLLWGMYGQE